MKNKLFILFAFLAWILPVVIATHNVFSGSIPFWFDPARDMLSAWSNLSKITLIGPPSGIPGFFYGPYWIWWVSIGEIISKDPRVVDFLIITLPYLLFFPFVLFLLIKVFGKVTSILLWLLFFYGFQSYFIFIWNPNLAPLIFLAIIYILITTDFSNLHRKILGKIFASGILTGLALNIHISFSVGFTFGALLYLFISSFLITTKKRILRTFLLVGSFLSGIAVIFLPFLFFEMRHGFMQSKTALIALAHGGGVVALQGLSKTEIIQSFFNPFGTLLEIPSEIAFVLIGAAIITAGVLFYRKKLSFTKDQKQLELLLVCISAGVLGVYLLAKNPIWNYHFVGAEILCLLFIGLLAAKIKPLQIVLAIWVMYLSIFQIKGFIQSFSVNQLTTQSLFAEQYIVTTIAKDAGSHDYTVYAYNPAIYSYEYSYLFKTMVDKNFSYDPGQIQREGTVYLILPQAKKSILDDFIHYHSPDKLYKTTKTWHIPNGIIILKRNPGNETI